MMRKFFGTDGIRGRTNEAPMTAEMAQRVGQAAGAHFLRGDHRHRVVIGKDTRLSGYMMESAMISGFTSVGMDVVMVGPVPTPAVAMLARSMRADLGVMISASHNPYIDNGIKLFGPDGYKLSDEDELAIEALIERGPKLVPAAEIGRARKIEDARGRYIHFAKSTFPEEHSLDGIKIVVDCANGAAYQVAPSALWELGAEVVSIGVSPNGLNINEGCGSTAPQALQQCVVEEGAHIGIALDGDADRLIVVDEKGKVVDGDQLMALIALSWARRGLLRGGAVVATVMSNLGLERHLQAGHQQVGVGQHEADGCHAAPDLEAGVVPGPEGLDDADLGHAQRVRGADVEHQERSRVDAVVAQQRPGEDGTQERVAAQDRDPGGARTTHGPVGEVGHSGRHVTALAIANGGMPSSLHGTPSA